MTCATSLTRENLLRGIVDLQARVEDYRFHARHFFYRVILSQYACPECEGALVLVKAGCVQCLTCEKRFDPTIQFQHSPCCNAHLQLHVSHYHCIKCRTIVPSRFLFDERVFDAVYFRNKMQESRMYKRLQRESKLHHLFAGHSDPLKVSVAPGAALPTELEKDLNRFIGSLQSDYQDSVWTSSSFQLDEYRRLIRHSLSNGARTFESFPILDDDDVRLDRVRRFMSLLIMESLREITLFQNHETIWVRNYANDR